jgi:Flp pilus assembly protein TadG
MGEERRHGGEGRGWLTRLARDRAGNTLAMMAATLVPLSAMIGSGLDMGRAYMTKSKLQNACDSAALAARRTMAASRLDAAAIAEGERFFHFNFPPGTMEAAPVTLRIFENSQDNSVVEVTAATTVPTTIMRMFGQGSIPIDVACSADQDYVNNDIMLVLDVTGSMNCTAGTTCEYAATEQSNSRLSRLRNGAASLYRALEGATGVRTRYGFMPYSMTVNVGRDLNAAWIANPAYYWRQVCTAFNTNGSCRTMSWQSFNQTHTTNWMTNTWGGCVEERATLALATQNPIRINGQVTQDDIDLVSTTDVRRKWQPYAPDVAQNYTGAYANLAAFCPARARRLAEYSNVTAFQNQVNASLTTVGGYTNHDLGIMWGMRYLSSTGIFAADNPEEYRGIRVEKHIVFMTDGVMTSTNTNYSAYGIHNAETRMTGSGTMVDRHKARFLAACNRARQMGATIWVIALDVQAPDDIRPCASGNDRFFVSNGSDLAQVFSLIGKGIGRLRVTS